MSLKKFTADRTKARALTGYRKRQAAEAAEWPGYKKFIASKRCCICNGRAVEVAHVGSTGKGMGAKCVDIETIPLCYECHRTGKHSIHRMGTKAFCAFWEIDIQGLIKKYQGLYLEEYENKIKPKTADPTEPGS